MGPIESVVYLVGQKCQLGSSPWEAGPGPLFLKFKYCTYKILTCHYKQTCFIFEVSLDVCHTGGTGHPSDVDVAFRVTGSIMIPGWLFVETTVQLIFHKCYTCRI